MASPVRSLEDMDKTDKPASKSSEEECTVNTDKADREIEKSCIPGKEGSCPHSACRQEPFFCNFPIFSYFSGEIIYFPFARS